MAGSLGPSRAIWQRLRYDSSKVDWKDFLTAGCYYKILDVNVAAHAADIIVKFDPGAGRLFHRHVAATTTMVLEGTFHVSIRPPMAWLRRSVGPAGRSNERLFRLALRVALAASLE
jgi:hypothetical protein